MYGTSSDFSFSDFVIPTGAPRFFAARSGGIMAKSTR
jgi:hypothetical protein